MTPQIHLHVLASGSKGNAAVVEGPEGSVLVDCGISRRALLGRADELGVDMGRVVAVVLTHEHSDHVGGLSVFCNRFDGPLYATAGTVAARRYLSELPFTLVGHSDEIEVAGMRMRTFPTSHDVADPVGLRFFTGDDALGFCTDTGELGAEALEGLAGARILALESNHDERMLATGDYPAWEYRQDSPFRDLMTEIFWEQYGSAPQIEAIHAGVECGILAGKLPGLDCVSVGPDLLDIHTPRERMDIASVQRVWRFVLEVLKRSK